MQLRLADGVFVRCFNEDVLFWSGRTTASAFLENAVSLCATLTADWECEDEIMRQIALKDCRALESVNSDYMPILNELLKLGIAESGKI